MDYNLLARLAKLEVILFVGGLGAFILARLVTGGINMNGLLMGKRQDGSMYLSPERVQALLATLSVAMIFLLNAAHSTTGKMPDLPAGALEVLGVSNAIYLGGKSWMMLRRPK